MLKHRFELAAMATLAFITIASTTPVLAQVTNQQVRIDSGAIEGAVSAVAVSGLRIRARCLRWYALPGTDEQPDRWCP
jgi:hypothetical protein